MRPLRSIGPALLAAAFLLPASCTTAHPRKPAGAARSKSHGSTNSPVRFSSPPRLDDKELERRVQAHAAFAAGVVSQMKDQGDDALDYFTKAVEADPENEELTLDVARRRLVRKEFDKAVELLQRAAARPGASGSVLSYLGLTQVQLGKTDAAIKSYREALKRMPGSLGSAGMLAQLLAEKNQASEALEVLKSVAKQGSDDPKFWVDLADLFQQQGTRSPDKAAVARKESLDALAKAEKLNPSEARVLRRIADRYYDAGQLADAERVYRQVRERAPRDPLPLARLAEIYLRGNKPKEATEQLLTLQRESPTDPIPPFYLGLIAVDEKKYDRAIELLERAILLGPEFELSYPELASIQLGMDRPQDALATLEKRAARFKPSFRAEYLAGLASARVNKIDDAMRHFTEAEARAKADQPALLDHRFYFQVGATLERAGRAEEATKHLLRSIELKSDFAEALNHLGYMWADKGENLERAHAMIRKAVDLEPDNEAFLDSLGWVLFKLGRPAEALPWLEKSAKLLEKPDPTIHDHLGDVLAALGRWKEAADHWRQALALEKNEAIQQKLDAVPKSP